MQQRRDSAANWTGSPVVLASGEIGVETDTGKIKVGNGAAVWSALPYSAISETKASSAWSSDTTTLITAGKICFNSDNGFFKIGDGTKTWSNLKYFKPSSDVSEDNPLNSLSDVTITSVAANNLLAYDTSGTSAWKNKTIDSLGIVNTASTTNKVSNDMLAGSIANDKLAGSIANDKLANSSITIGSTSTSLGATSSSLAGLTDVTATGTVQGATVTSTGTVNSTNLRATSTGASTSSDAAIITGSPTGNHIGISTGGISAMSDATTNSTLTLNGGGGDITIGQAGASINIAGTLANGNIIAAGTATAGTAPLELTAGTNLTTPEAGAIEYDGSFFYATQDTTSGRGTIPVNQTFRLESTGTAFGTAIGDFYGASTAINLAASSVYEIEFFAYFLKTTAGTATFTLTATSAPTQITGYYIGSGITGINVAAAPTTGYAGSANATTAAFAATGSLTNAVRHAYKFNVTVITNDATTFRLRLTQSAGTATPLAGSYYKVNRISTTQGSFA
jgi:hypothetical protein